MSRFASAAELCLRAMRGDPARYYQPAGSLPLGAGLLMRNCKFALPDIEEVRFRTARGLVLVLTHECDVDQNNDRNFNDAFLLVPITPLEAVCEAYEAEGGIGAWGGILPKIASGDVFRVMYLPPPAKHLGIQELPLGGIIYLNHITYSIVEWIQNFDADSVCSLSAVGLRVLDQKIKNHLERPKSVTLWGER